MAVDSGAFRSTMSYWPSGVSLVTSSDSEAAVGLTVSSFTSLSLDPPMVLVCVHNHSHSLKVIVQSGRFAVNILAEGQDDLSRRFATRLVEDKFRGVCWHQAATGAPILDDALAWLDCEVVNHFDGGDHQIIIGLVLATGAAAKDEWPLIYYRRSYQQLMKTLVEYSIPQ